MPPQTQTQPVSTPGSLDPQVVNMAKAIRQSESGGNFTASGKSGEYGAYQFTPDTWNASAQKYLGQHVNLQDATPEQQNEVAYKQIKEWKDAGNNLGQVASMWNAGAGEPNAYTGKFSDGSPSKGVNKHGASFDVPTYAKSVATAYQTLKSGGQVQADPQNPSSISNTTPLQPPQNNQQENLWQKAGDVGKGLVDFAFPIVKDVVKDFQGQSQKSILQQLGDAGLSALWFIPGLGTGAGIGAHILEGAGIGYGADVASKLSSGKTDIGGLLTPGAGTLTGGIAGGVFSKLSNVLGKNFTQTGALQSLEDNLSGAMGATKTGRKFLTASEQTGFKPAKILAQSMSIPDIVDGKFSTTAAEANVKKAIAQLGETRASALDSMGITHPIEDLRNEALAQVKGLAATGQTQKITNQINNLVDDLKLNYGENLNPTALEKIKEAQASASGIYKRTGQIGEQNAASLIGNAARTRVENLANQSGFPGMREYNNYVQAYYNALEGLKKLNGQAVKGGRLGNMLRGHTMAGISALAGNAAGGGFLGTIAYGLAGEGANNILSKIMGNASLSNPLRDKILERIAQENPEIVQRLQQFAGSSGKIAPLLTPKSTGKITGMLPNLLMKTAARGATTGQ